MFLFCIYNIIGYDLLKIAGYSKDTVCLKTTYFVIFAASLQEQ